MSTATHSGSRRLALLAGTAALALAVGACGQGTAAPSQTAGVTAPVPTSAGPTAFASWTARQGFGGTSGLRNVLKLATWLRSNATTADTYELQSDLTDINGLISWLDQHPATSCWSAFHDQVRADLAKLPAPYATAIQARTASIAVSSATASAIVSAAQAAQDLPAPPNCP